MGSGMGVGCHILLHVPADLVPLFRSKTRHWARAVIAKRGGTYAVGTTECQIVRCSTQPSLYPDAYRSALTFKVHYML